MTGTSDGRWIAIYSVVATLFVLSWVYIPA